MIARDIVLDEFAGAGRLIQQLEQGRGGIDEITGYRGTIIIRHIDFKAFGGDG